MTCDCIETIERDKLPEHRIDVAICFSGSALVARTFSRLIRRDNGQVETRRKRHHSMVATFCPFCGERYEPEPAQPKEPHQDSQSSRSAPPTADTETTPRAAIAQRGAAAEIARSAAATSGGLQPAGDGNLFEGLQELIALAYQYRDDLNFPPAPDSRERRIARIDAAILALRRDEMGS